MAARALHRRIESTIQGTDDTESNWAEALVSHKWVGRGRARTLKIKVRWWGYGPDDDTWEPFAQVNEDCPELCTAYMAAAFESDKNLAALARGVHGWGE